VHSAHSIWRTRDLFPLETAPHLEIPYNVVTTGHGRPFGLRYLIDAHSSANCELDLSSVRFDDELQIAVMNGESGGMPAFKHTSGQTSTTTSIDDRKAPDSDTDYEPDK